MFAGKFGAVGLQVTHDVLHGVAGKQPGGGATHPGPKPRKVHLVFGDRSSRDSPVDVRLVLLQDEGLVSVQEALQTQRSVVTVAAAVTDVVVTDAAAVTHLVLIRLQDFGDVLR